MSQPPPANSKRRDVLTVAIAAIIALMLGVNLFMFFDDGPDEELVAADAPGFELPVMDGDGETVALEELTGKVVLIDFWATWCPPCRDQMPELEAIADDPELEDQVAVLSVNTDPDTEDRFELIEEFMREENLELPTLIDDGSTQAAYRAGTIPTLVVVDPDGQVIYVSEGVHDEERLRELVEKAADGR